MNESAVDVRHVGDLETVTKNMSTVTTEQVAAARELTSWTDIFHVLRSKDFEIPQPQDGFGWDWQAKMMGDAVNHLQGKLHTDRRRVLSALVRSENLRRYEDEVLVPSLERALDGLARKRGPDGVVRGDLAVLSETILLALMAEFIGLDGIADDADNLETFRGYFRRLDAGNRVRYTTDDPEQVLRTGLDAQRDILTDFFEPAWARYSKLVADADAGRSDADAVPDNLIVRMLRNRQHYDQWDAHVYGREVSLFVGASIGSTSTTICNTFIEIEKWIDEHPADADVRLDEDFLLRAVEEAIRLRGSLWLTRVAVTDTTLPDGDEIAAGTVIWLNLAAAYPHALGPDAWDFNPYRQVPERFPRWGGGFGDGRHVCLGKALVLGEGTEGNQRRGTALTVLKRLYSKGLRRDAQHDATLGKMVRQKYTSCPVTFVDL